MGNNKLSVTKLTGKKKMQVALKLEIERINTELEKLGIYGEIKYKCAAITNHETPQNTINISNMNDISSLLRFLAYYENLKQSVDKYIKEFKIENIIPTNLNSQPIENIIHDLVLRIKVLTNSAKINSLNAAKIKLMPFLDEESRLINTLKEVQQLYSEMK